MFNLDRNKKETKKERISDSVPPSSRARWDTGTEPLVTFHGKMGGPGKKPGARWGGDGFNLLKPQRKRE